MPEIHEAAPHAVFVPRKVEVNAWDNALFVKPARDTGKKTLVMASVCVMFPALDAKAAVTEGSISAITSYQGPRTSTALTW